MASTDVILAIDSGTTSCRSLAFDHSGKIVEVSQMPLTQIYPQDGWVEHDANEIWENTLETAKEVISQCHEKGQKIKAIGITNQRETVVIWNLRTGKPIHNALVWQDRRTSDVCEALKAQGASQEIQARTGLLLDPYFSASKISWILDHVGGARESAERGELAFGTVDSFLIWKLTGGAQHLTDETNASRTSLYNIHLGKWDETLLKLFNVPASILPEVLPSMADFGNSDPDILGACIPISGVAGDQQAASFGQGCFHAGMAKATYGTGCFILMSTGDTAVNSSNKLLTTLACRFQGKVQYALEGSIFIAGAVVQWMKESMGIIQSSSESERIAKSMDTNSGVYLVPAFTGLGAPHWSSDARGSIYGLTRETGADAIVRAGVESVAYQTADLLKTFASDGQGVELLRVDGGMSQNNWLMQFIADMTQAHLQRSANFETTALGAAMLAGLQVGFWTNEEEALLLAGNRTSFTSKIDDESRVAALTQWDIAVKTTLYRTKLQNEAMLKE